MPLTREQVTVGTRLSGRYKQEDFTATVVQTLQGLRYRLADGRQFRSPSGAGRAVMGGVACNGWRFWSLAEHESPGIGTSADSTDAEPLRH